MPVLQANRAKLSTTVALETYEYLEGKVASGEAASLAEAVDNSIRKIRRLENRERLAKATAQYFDQMESQVAAEESSLAKDIAAGGAKIDFDHEL